MSRESTESMENAPASLKFITVTGASYRHGKKPQQHPDVRRYVMLGRRRRERLAATREFQHSRTQDATIRFAESTGQLVSGADGGIDKLASQKKGRDTREKQSDSLVEGQLALARQHPAGWRLDPFESFAAPLDEHVQAAIEYYAKVMVPSTRPSDLISQNRHTAKAINFILSDDLMIDSFAAAMAIGRAMNVYASESRKRQVSNQIRMNEVGASAAQASVVRAESAQESARGPMTTGLAYMTKALRKLNQRVRNSGFNPDDAIIGTVTQFLVCEILTGETLRGEIHCQGICAMIKARGGPDAILSSLMDSVFLSDMHMATMSHRQPSYQLLDTHQYARNTALPQACNSFGLSPYRSESLALGEGLKSTLNPEFCASLERLQDIVNYANTFNKSLAALPVELRRLYQSKCFAVEHEILSQILPHGTDIRHKVADFCIVTSLLFIYTCIQKWSSYSPLVRIVVRQLQSSLSNLSGEILLALDSSFFLWALFIGAHASFGQVTRPWFVMMITQTISQLPIEDWIDMHAFLAACYYIDGMFEEAFAEIWLEVRASEDFSDQEGDLNR